MSGHNTPWRANGTEVEDANGRLIAGLDWAPQYRHGERPTLDEARSTAEHIVRAVNGFDPLVAALERIVERGFSAQAEEQARAALALAREEVAR